MENGSKVRLWGRLTLPFVSFVSSLSVSPLSRSTFSPFYLFLSIFSSFFFLCHSFFCLLFYLTSPFPRGSVTLPLSSLPLSTPRLFLSIKTLNKNKQIRCLRTHARTHKSMKSTYTIPAFVQTYTQLWIHTRACRIENMNMWKKKIEWCT